MELNGDVEDTELDDTGYYDINFQNINELDRTYFISEGKLVSVGIRSRGLENKFVPVTCKQ